MRIKGTYGTMYYVSQMEDARAFFEENLRLEPSFASPEWTEFSMANHKLCLHFLTNGEIHPRTGILILEVEGLQELYESMQDNGVRFHSEIRNVSEQGRACDFFDLDGNIISLYERIR